MLPLPLKESECEEEEEYEEEEEEEKEEEEPVWVESVSGLGSRWPAVRLSYIHCLLLLALR